MTIRLKMLQKIAQTQTTAPTIPTTITGSPASVSVSMFPSTIIGWGSNNTSHIQKIIDTLNMTLFVLSNGKIDFDKMKQQNFNVDLSSYVAVIKGVASLSEEFYQKVLVNNGVPYKEDLKPEEKTALINNLKESPSFDTIPDGGISSLLSGKIGGNFKTIILNSLNNIK